MIPSFTGAYRFLSNFWLAEVVYDNMRFRSAEHAYQAAKVPYKDRVPWLEPITPSDAKRLGRRAPLRPHWIELRLPIMTIIVRDKFTRHSDLRTMLLATQDRELIEGNHWNDTFWGVCRGQGENHLGKILMQVRQELR